MSDVHARARRRGVAADEVNWALECLGSGDSLEEVAEWSGRGPDLWRAVLGRLAGISERSRPRLEAYAAGVSMREIGDRDGVCWQAVWWTITKARNAGLIVPMHGPGSFDQRDMAA
jgi:hypothetical protein